MANGETFKRGDPVLWNYRSAVGHGYVKGVARDDNDADKVLYDVSQVDNHPGEPSVVQHTGAALRRSTHDAVEAARAAAEERDKGTVMGHKIKSVAAVRVKAGPADGLAEGEFLVYPSTFTRTPDSYGDVVAKGAFAKAIGAWHESGDSMPAMYLHDPNQIVGKAIDMGEDDHGWWVKGAFLPDPASQRIYEMVKDRLVSALSFRYDTIDEASVTLDGGTKANELREVFPHEFSFLPKGFAANADTSVVAVKAERAAGAIAGNTAVLLDELKAGRRVAGAPLEKLRAAHAGIAEFIAWAEKADEEDASASDDAKAALSGADGGDAGRPGDDDEAAAKAAAQRKAGTAQALALLTLSIPERN